MRRNLLLLSGHVPQAAAILPILNSGPVVIFSGHMIDQPQRTVPRFPDHPPLVDLDPDFYKRVDQLEARLRVVPSLKGCRHLRVRGPVVFENPAMFKGNVAVANPEKADSSLPAGSYEDLSLTLRGGRVEASPNRA